MVFEKYKQGEIMTDKKVLLSTNEPPTSDEYKELKDNGQQKDYIVLSDEERAKGFVRPYRDKYIHVGIKPRFPLRELTKEEALQYSGEKYVSFEEYPESEHPAVGRYWTAKQLKTCGGETVMGQKLSETYARDPKFYGATFCASCGNHFPVAEFVWSKDNEVVGS